MGLNKRLISSEAAAAVVPTNTDNFAPVLYTGNSTNDQSVTGVGFQPDFVWIKSRNTGTGTTYHGLWDSVRGTGGHLYASIPNGETNTPNRLYSFDSDGFSLGNGVDPEYIGNNNYVAWCWKAGGAAVSNTDGTITSQVSANTDAGFSIVKYTKTATVPGTIGHGLNAAPEIIFEKRTDDVRYWNVRVEGITANNQTLYLNQPTGVSTHPSLDLWTTPTDSVFGYSTALAGASDNIAYCFHSVDGYQKVGSYGGNSTSGRLINTGFQPRFVLIKTTNATSNWFILDAVRGGTQDLRANSTNAEETRTNGVTFVSNGFEIDDTSVGFNNSGTNYIYLAIA